MLLALQNEPVPHAASLLQVHVLNPAPFSVQLKPISSVHVALQPSPASTSS
jgi:hypothetical protein